MSSRALLLRCCHIPQQPEGTEKTVVGRLISELVKSGCQLESLLYNCRHWWSVPPLLLYTVVSLSCQKCKNPLNRPSWSPWVYTNHCGPLTANPSLVLIVSIPRCRCRRNIFTLNGSQTSVGHPRSLWMHRFSVAPHSVNVNSLL